MVPFSFVVGGTASLEHFYLPSQPRSKALVGPADYQLEALFI